MEEERRVTPGAVLRWPQDTPSNRQSYFTVRTSLRNILTVTGSVRSRPSTIGLTDDGEISPGIVPRAEAAQP